MGNGCKEQMREVDARGKRGRDTGGGRGGAGMYVLVPDDYARRKNTMRCCDYPPAQRLSKSYYQAPKAV